MRPCEDCGCDISYRHHLARRCCSCAKKRQKARYERIARHERIESRNHNAQTDSDNKFAMFEKFKRAYAKVYKRYLITMSDGSSNELHGLNIALECMDIDKNDFSNFLADIKKELSICKTCGGHIDRLSYIRCPNCGCGTYEMFGNIHQSDENDE